MKKRILIVKLSSMGDVLHAMPVLHDIKQALGDDVEIDWVTEPSYAVLLENHPYISHLLTFPWRKYGNRRRKIPASPEAKQLKQFFKRRPYDLILDLQGLSKSVAVARWAKGPRAGYSWNSIREPLASLFYQHKIKVSKDLHAVTRMRELAAAALAYPIPTADPNYGMQTAHQSKPSAQPNIILFPFTTWSSKHWPITYWQQLISICQDQYQLSIAWGSATEKQIAESLCANQPHCDLTPDLNIAQMKNHLTHHQGFIGVDTGFSHLATAMNIPGLVLMGPTDQHKSGPLGKQEIALDANLSCSPCHKRDCPLPIMAGAIRPACLAAITPDMVYAHLQRLVPSKDN